MAGLQFNVVSTFYVVVLVCMLLGSTITDAASRSKHAEDKEDNDEQSTIQIVGYGDGTIQRLPAQYVLQSFDRWILLQEEQEAGTAGTKQLQKIGDSDFVNPTSISVLWWPVDIPIMQARPTLDIILQHGQPKYVASGLDVRVRVVNDDGIDTSHQGKKDIMYWWRNHGMNSQPLANQWTMFEAVGKSNFRVEVFIEKYRKDDDGNTQWDQISSTKEATKKRISLNIDCGNSLRYFQLKNSKFDTCPMKSLIKK